MIGDAGVLSWGSPNPKGWAPQGFRECLSNQSGSNSSPCEQTACSQEGALRPLQGPRPHGSRSGTPVFPGTGRNHFPGGRGADSLFSP